MKLFPITQTQQGIYFECLRHASEAVYNNAYLFRFTERIDIDKLARAVEQVVTLRPVLFTHIVEDADGVPCMSMPAPKDCVYAQAVEHVSDEDFIHIREQLKQPFDIHTDGLFRLRLFDTETTQYLFVDTHHIISDGLSLRALLSDLESVYAGRAVRTEAISAFDIAEAEQSARAGEAYANAKQWTEATYAGSEGTIVPDGDINNDKEEKHGEYQQNLSTSYADLSRFCEAQGVSQAALAYGVFGRLLGVLTDKKDVAFASIWHGRHDRHQLRTIQMMVKTFAVRCRYDEPVTVSDYLHAIHTQNEGAMTNDIYSFAEVAAATGINSHVLFAYQGTMHRALTFAGVAMEQVSGEDNATNEPLSLQLMVQGDELLLDVQYFSNLYSEAYIRRMVECYDALMQHMMASPDALVHQTSVMSERQLAQVSAMHQTTMADAPTTTFHEGVLRWAKETPDTVAVIASDKTLTYSELNTAVEQLAAELQARGLQHGDRVVLLLPRRSSFIVSMLAVMRCGAAYIPMDPEYPADRIAYILDDSEGRFVITTSDKVADYENRALNIEELLHAAESRTTAAPVAVDKDDLAYLIYTSGSTGKPKGVMIRHDGAAHFLMSHEDNLVTYIMGHESRVVIGLATVSFDMSIMEYGSTLYNGRTFVFADEEQVLNPLLLAELCRKTGVETMSSTPSRLALNMGIDEFRGLMGKQIRTVMVGGEKLPAALMDDLRSLGVQLINAYGPTEITIACSSARMNEANEVHIGRPHTNYTYRIMDRDLNELPVGIIGELVIGGRCLARGYNNQPEKTAEVFVTIDGERMYRSGDYARWTEDGNVVILGRTDNQVKLNGLRIELGEIETVLGKQDAIQQCVVMVRKVAGNDKLVAYYVPETAAANEDEARAFERELADKMSQSLTYYMVPSVFVAMQSFPITPAGKIDTRALPEPTLVAEEIVAPETEREEQLLSIVRDVLQQDEFGVTTNLLTIGMTSLLAIRVAVLAKKQYGLDIRVGEMLKTPTVRAIAANATIATESDEMNAIEHHAGETFPMTFAQQGVYMECLRNPEATFYNIPMLIRMPAGTNAETLRDHVATLISLHPAYFTHFAPEGDEVKMFYPESMQAEVEVKNLTEDEYEQFKQTCVRPFDLANGPLYRSSILKVADRVYLFFDSHHLISDGGSTNVIFQQLTALMQGATVEAERYTYFDFANDQRRFAESEAFEEHKQYFATQLSDFEEVTEVQQDLHAGGTAEQHEAIAYIRNTGRGQLPDGATEAHFWLAATTYTLGRFAGTKNIYISTVSGGRQNLKVSETVGMFVNTLPIHAHIREQRVREYIKENADTFRDTMAHENYPFARIAADYGYTAATTYAFQLGLVDSYMQEDSAMHVEVLGMESPKFKIGIMIDVRDGKPAVICQYDSTLYTRRLMQALADSIEATAMHMLADPDAPVASISIVPDGQLERVTEMGFCARLDYPMDDTLVSIFRRTAAAHPDKTAVVFRDKHLTYKEMDELTDRLAAHLTTLGIGQGSIVGVMIERSELMAVYPMAIMKTGGAYMPLDPEFPEDRLTFMIEDAGVHLILSDDGLVQRVLPNYTDEIFERSAIDSLETPYRPLSKSKDDPRTTHGRPTDDNQEGALPDSLMVVLYTSGSTGKPKGVLLEQHNIVNFCYWYVSAFAMSEHDKAAAFANFGFDAHMLDLYPAFLAGAEVHILDAEIRHDLQGMANYFNDNQLTIAFMTTQICCQMVTLFELPTMRLMSAGGEKMPPLSPPAFDFYNVYGPTECSLFSTYYKVTGPFDGRLIGKPLTGYRLYVVDQDKNILPIGAAGELLIMGDGVARGYLNRPDVNSEKFIEYQGEKAYSSGDRVRWTEAGDIEYMGRMDGQVKLRGLRIELGEVDSVMSRHPAIKMATAAVKEVSGTQHLCGYYMLRDGATLDEQELRDFMRQSLTEFMIPDFLLCMETMPLTPNGKVDKRALPLPAATAATEYVEPRNDVERFFCDTIAQVLNVERVGAEDNFFEIGGTSLIAMRLSVAVGNAGYPMAYKDFFDNPTPAKMAAFVSGGATAEPEIDHEIVDYDYTALNELVLRNNVETYLADSSLNDLGRVLLLGATGYLGIHVLKQLLDDESVPAIQCMVRGSKSISAESRLRTLLFYYFGETYEADFGNRLMVINGDITNAECFDTIENIDTVINCAANVKHFSAGTDIEDINYHGAVNCLNLCLRLGARFIQTSTCSIGGSTLSDTAQPEPHCLRESELYYGQDLSNKYAHSKFLAERAILEAVATKGLKAKIMRLGNLAPRAMDGEFQANFNTNASMRRLKAHTTLGAVAYSMMVGDIEFTPIDEAARAVLLLSRTNDNCNVFHIVNPHHSPFGDVINCLRHAGYDIRAVEMPEFTQMLMAAMADPAKADIMQSLVAYSMRSDGRYAVGNTYMSLYTAEILLRLGFNWNPTSWDYVEQFIHAIQGLGFFDE